MLTESGDVIMSAITVLFVYNLCVYFSLILGFMLAANTVAIGSMVTALGLRKK